MNIQIFTLCEFAQTNNGKTTIIGTFNRVTAQSFPLILPDLYVVLKLAFLESINTIISITLRKKGGHDIITTGPQTLSIQKMDDRESIHDIVFRINQVSFLEPGDYEVAFKIGKEEYTTGLYVEKK